jgi:hypothetical protein
MGRECTGGARREPRLVDALGGDGEQCQARAGCGAHPGAVRLQRRGETRCYRPPVCPSGLEVDQVQRGVRRSGIGVLATAALLGGLVSGVAAPPAGALTPIPVTTATDAALRAAFTTANATNDDVVIEISVGSATIDLTGGVLAYTGGTGGTHALTIEGNGATIDQTTPGAAVVSSNSTSAIPFTLDGITITGGNTNASTTAAVRANGSPGSLTITNSTVTGNTSALDIIDAGITKITNSHIDTNMVTTSGTGDCDGIIDTGDTMITSSTVSGNHCETTGSGTAQGPIFPSNLTLTNSVVQNNTNTSTGTGDADAIIDSTATTVSGSAVVGNTDTAASGTAEGTVWPTTMTMTTSTVANNTNSSTTGDAVGAGINMGTESLTLTDSTVANNTNTGGGVSEGGGIFQGSLGSGALAGGSAKHPKGGGAVGAAATSTITLVYNTVVGNTATVGANIDAGQLISFGSVVALPTGGVNCVLASPTTSNGFNFSDDATCGFTTATDHPSAGNPDLAPLADNGGPGPTRLPQAGSPLIDAIPVASCQADGAAGITTDERGVTRPQGAGCDIGAVEVVPALVTAAFTG